LDKLSPVEQKLIQEAATEAQNYQRVVSRDAAGKALAELKAKGMMYNDVSPAELARMRAEVKPIYDKFAASYDPAVVKEFKAELERISKLRSNLSNADRSLHEKDTWSMTAPGVLSSGPPLRPRQDGSREYHRDRANVLST
jgi:TRAP-type mannitol/chloroaromatic compound transport system substrate-binding protein